MERGKVTLGLLIPHSRFIIISEFLHLLNFLLIHTANNLGCVEAEFRNTSTLYIIKYARGDAAGSTKGLDIADFRFEPLHSGSV